MRYRYITAGCKPTDLLSDFRLIGSFRGLCPLYAVRVTLPDSVELTKYSCDTYSTTEAKIELKDLVPVVCVRCNSRFKPNQALTKDWLTENVSVSDFYKWMRDAGYVPYPRYGFITCEQLSWLDRCIGNEKNWQLDKIPKTNEPVELIPESEYKVRFKEYFDEVANALKGQDKVNALIKELNVSDEKLFDLYATTCFNRACDTKLRLGLGRIFVMDLEAELKEEKWLNDAIGNC